MKVAIVHYAASPIVGGVESVIAAHAGLMAADGHDVRIVAGRGGTNDAGSVVPSTGGAAWHPGSAVVVPVPLIDPIHERVAAMQVELSAGRVPDSFEALVAELRGQTRLLGLTGMLASGVLAENAREHLLLVDLVEARDAAGAEALMHAHIARTRTTWAGRDGSGD